MRAAGMARLDIPSTAHRADMVQEGSRHAVVSTKSELCGLPRLGQIGSKSKAHDSPVPVERMLESYSSVHWRVSKDG